MMIALVEKRKSIINKRKRLVNKDRKKQKNDFIQIMNKKIHVSLLAGWMKKYPKMNLQRNFKNSVKYFQ